MLCSTEIKQCIDDQGGLNLPSYFRLEATMGNGFSWRTDRCLQAIRSIKLHNAPVMCKKEPQSEWESGLEPWGIKTLILCLLIGFLVPCTYQLLKSFTGDTTWATPSNLLQQDKWPQAGQTSWPPVTSSHRQPCHTSAPHNCTSPRHRQLFTSAPSEPGV